MQLDNSEWSKMYEKLKTLEYNVYRIIYFCEIGDAYWNKQRATCLNCCVFTRCPSSWMSDSYLQKHITATKYIFSLPAGSIAY